jgi:hypothetical protein
LEKEDATVRGLFAVMSVAVLLIGAVDLVVVIRSLNEGEPSRPFIGPRALWGVSGRPGHNITEAGHSRTAKAQS